DATARPGEVDAQTVQHNRCTPLPLVGPLGGGRGVGGGAGGGWGGGGGGGGGGRKAALRVSERVTPLPNPPPQGGREQAEAAARAEYKSPERAVAFGFRCCRVVLV